MSGMLLCQRSSSTLRTVGQNQNLKNKKLLALAREAEYQENFFQHVATAYISSPVAEQRDFLNDCNPIKQRHACLTMMSPNSIIIGLMFKSNMPFQKLLEELRYI